MSVGKTRTVLWLGATALAYVLAHQVGMIFLDPTARSSTVWPATGIGLAALLLTPRAQRKAVYVTLSVSNLATNLLIGATWVAALGALATGMLELLFAVWCLERQRTRIDFEKVRDVTGLLCAATLGCALAASFGAGSTVLAHGVEFWRTHRTWWVADGLGMLTVGTLIVAWARAPRDEAPWQGARLAEQLAFLLVWLGVAWFTFSGGAWLPEFAPGPYILIALLAWPSLRMGQRWVTLALALLAATAILSTRTGSWHSPWGGRTLHERLLFLQIYLGFTSGSALLFAASVSERRAAQRASDEAEERSRVDAERLAGALESAGMATWDWDIATNAVYWSPNVDAVLGTEPGIFQRNFGSYMTLVHADDRVQLDEAIQAVMGRGGNASYGSQHRVVTPAGDVRWMESKGRLHCDAQGKALRLAGTLTDVTEHKRTEQAVVAGDLLLRQCIKYTPAAVAMFDTQMRYLQASDRWLADYHLDGQNLIGRSHYEVFPDVPARWKEIHQRVLAGAVERNDDDPFPRDDGHTEWLQWEVRPWRKPDDQIGGLVMFTQVVTERKQAEERNRQLQEQLRQAQKLEALGTLAGGIAHDFNNILAAIVAFTQIAQLDNPDNADLQSHLGEVLGASSRAANLVQQILSFSRRQRQERKTQSLAPIIREALKLLRSTLPTTIEIREDIAPELPDVLADPTQMHQVLMNLCTNASHAMKGRGELKLSIAPYKLEANATSPHLELRPGRYVRLTVTDSGAGMDEHVLSRIFEPFFTTKASGEGTGLGLAVVHGIIKEHEGTITVQSRPGRGTTFTVYLPAAASAQPLVDDTLAELMIGHRERVLFVDDETALCAVATQLLERLGYEPHVFQDPEAAWLAFRADPQAFDVVISDLTMPGRTGLDLADDVLRLRPDCPIILCSGYSATLTSTMLGEMGIRELLFKPVDYRSLAAALSRVLPRQLSQTA